MKPATQEKTADAQPRSVQQDCCACCREDTKAILKWINDVTEQLRTAPAIQTDVSVALWNLRAELENNVRSRSTHNDQALRSVLEADVERKKNSGI